jgi:hypothetical protein
MENLTQEEIALDEKIGDLYVAAEKITAIGQVMWAVDADEYFIMDQDKKTIMNELWPNYGQILMNTGRGITEILDGMKVDGSFNHEAEER